MVKSEEEVRKLLKRLKETADGQEFIDYLRLLSAENYYTWKNASQEHNEIHKGYALSVDNLVDSFAECDKEPAKEKKPVTDF